MLDKILMAGACLFLLGMMSFVLSVADLQFTFMSFLGAYKSTFDYAAIGIGLVVCVVGSRIKKNRKDIDS